MTPDTNSNSTAAGPGPARHAFTLYAANGRVYASNVAQKLVDLGSFTKGDDGFGYRLDGNGLAGSGFSDPDAALRDLGGRLEFLFLDGQFTALVDVRGNEGVELDGVPQRPLLLDELAPGERMQDARV